MGLCQSAPHSVALTIEEIVLEAPYEREIIRNNPVVYIRHQIKGKDKLLNFTTTIPTCVGISAVWNQVRYIHLEEKDPERIEIVVGENPRYRGYVEDIRNVSGDILVDIDEYENGENMGTVGVLRVEVTQKYMAAEPPTIPTRSFARPGYEANLSVFLYQAENVERSLLLGGGGGPKKLQVDIALHTPEEDVRVPTNLAIDDRAIKKGGEKINPVWNEGFHFQNLTEEPRFLDVRFNAGSEDDSTRACARIDLFEFDVWGKGQDWKWHPITAEDRHDQKFYRVLVVDDTESGPELERLLTVLGTDPLLEADAEAALVMLCADEYAMLSQFEMIFVNIRQKGGMDGITFAQKIREAERKIKKSAVCIIGVDNPVKQSTIDRDRRILQVQGISDLIHKPLVKRELRWILQRYVRNVGVVLLDIVVTYTPAGAKGALEAYNAQRAKRLSAKLKRSGSQSLRGAMRAARAQDSNADGQTRLHGLLELQVLRTSLKDPVLENHNIIYIVTLNHQVLETKVVHQTREGEMIKDEPIEWNEDVRLWIQTAGDEYTNHNPLNLSIAVYAYPIESPSWTSEDLIGRWSSAEQPENFWAEVNGKYSSQICQLTRTTGAGKVVNKGFMEIRAIVRHTQEIARRLLHDAYMRSCDAHSLVSRGEVSTLLHNIRPIVTDPDEQAKQRARRFKREQRSKTQLTDENGNAIAQSDEDEESDTEDWGTKDRPALPVFERIDRFLRDSAHYTWNGQSYIGESTVMEMVDLKQLSYVK